MRDYLLIESCRADAGEAPPHPWRFAGQLADNGDRVSMYLVGNAVLLARRAAREPRVLALIAAGVAVLADETSLRERNVETRELLAGVAPASLDRVIDALAAGMRVHWC
jgi:intracellular sulfur oxidation DsrE/DsrF family protein